MSTPLRRSARKASKEASERIHATLTPKKSGGSARPPATTAATKAKEAAPSSSGSSALWGDVGNVVVFVNAAAYLVVSVGSANGWLDEAMGGELFSFSPSVAKEGFCVSNRDQSIYHQSHFLSFYGDMLGSLLLLLLIQTSNAPAMALVKRNVPGIFAHGLAHAWIGYGGVSEGPGALFQDKTPQLRFMDFVILFTFWTGLLRAILDFNKTTLLALASFHTVVLQLVPARFGFTYVHTALLLTAAMIELGRSDKDYNYALYAWVVGVPIGFVAWVEALACDNFLIHYGGHMCYDMTIVISVLLFCLLTRGDAPMEKKNK